MGLASVASLIEPSSFAVIIIGTRKKSLVHFANFSILSVF